MSVNVKFSIVVRDIPDPAIPGLLAALRGVMREESLVEDTLFETDAGIVQVYTPTPVIISGFGRWHPSFEARVKQAVEASTPGLSPRFHWTYPDED